MVDSKRTNEQKGQLYFDQVYTRAKYKKMIENTRWNPERKNKPFNIKDYKFKPNRDHKPSQVLRLWIHRWIEAPELSLGPPYAGE